jgi:hypothetical protein
MLRVPLWLLGTGKYLKEIVDYSPKKKKTLRRMALISPKKWTR